MFTVQAQETLLKLPWPERLLQDDFCRNVTAGDVWNDSRVAGQGSLVMSGLRVRMGINTGALGFCKGVQLVVFDVGLGLCWFFTFLPAERLGLAPCTPPCCAQGMPSPWCCRT